ncbi:hypothetical protein V6N12_004067 [Hibiscus sabdariffa]|uniref:Uncharacterized protein n=1 Tax=Hibiscus sabdariffa TaxID=183260 RepID=A0ABR2CKD3_9ROSI
MVSVVWSFSSERHRQSFSEIVLGSGNGWQRATEWRRWDSDGQWPRESLFRSEGFSVILCKIRGRVLLACLGRWKVVSVSSDVEARIENCSWWFFLDQMTMVQWSVLEMAIDVSEIKFSKSVRNCYQTKMKPCPFAISDEWYVLAVKHRRSSDELDLAKDDGWKK